MSSFREIAEKMDPIRTPTGLAALLEMHRWCPSEERSFRAICNRHDNPRKLERRFLFFNTYLLDASLIAEKPAVDDRAPKIGELIRDNFDIALLCEVFEDNVKDKILSAWPDGSRPDVVEDASWSTSSSSGLVTISQQDPLDGKVFYEYVFETGWDALADKGAMLTRIDLGFGSSKLELYNTHLNSGSALIRNFQVLELVSFIERTHDERNVAILAGDFNIHAFSQRKYTKNPYAILPVGVNSGADHILERLASGDFPDGMSEYEILVELLNLIGFKDVWVQRNGTPGYTSNMDKIGVADQICRPDTDSLFCDDFNVPGSHDDFSTDDKSNRIDFIFISNPSDSHSFNLDFTRPRRVRRERRAGAPERDEIAFLSDHVGLATTFMLSPK